MDDNSGPTPRAMGLAILVIGLLGALLFGAISNSCDNAQRREEAAVAADVQKKRDEATHRATIKRVTSASSPSIELAKDCRSLGSDVPSASFAICRDSEVLFAKSLPDSAGARAAVDAAVSHGLSSHEADRMYASVNKTAKREASEQKAAQRKKDASDAKDSALGRKVYGAALRERFLDKGMDIKVHVSGRNNDHITLEWVLFNDVWTHQMEKPDGLAQEMKGLGFKRVDVKSGYDYHVYWDF